MIFQSAALYWVLHTGMTHPYECESRYFQANESSEHGKFMSQLRRGHVLPKTAVYSTHFAVCPSGPEF